MSKRPVDAGQTGEITRLLAAASHDLRQPLQALAMFTAVLAGRNRDATLNDLIARIQDSVGALEQLLGTLIEMAKLDAGLVKANVAEFAVAPLLSTLVDEFAPACGERGLELRLVPSRARVIGDAGLLRAALRHLIDNAVKFTSAGRVVVGCRRSGGALRFEICDTGIGIPAAALGDIFRAFHQAGEPERRQRQGLGLGLTISSRMAVLMGSSVEVHSQEGRGSVFSIALPLADNTAAQPDQMALGLSRSGATVMVVDDEPEVRESLSMLLQSWGYRVLSAAGAEECGRAVDRLGRAPDLILADFRLSGGETGGDAIARAEARSGMPRRIPAIILTGDTAPERLRQAMAAGHTLLHKPVQATALRAAIDTALMTRLPPPRRRAQAERLTA